MMEMDVDDTDGTFFDTYTSCYLVGVNCVAPPSSVSGVAVDVP